MTKIKYFLFLTGFVFTFMNITYAQTNWSADKELTAEDFLGDSYVTDSISSHFEYDLSFKYQKKSIRDTNIVYYEAVAFMEEDDSWIAPDADTKTELRLNQVLFDQLELERRNLQVFLDTVEHPLMVDSLFPLYFDTLKTTLAEIHINYEGASDKDTYLTGLEKELSTALDSTIVEGIPTFTLKKRGKGAHLALGMGVYNNTLSEHFTNPFLLEAGADIYFPKFILQLTGTVGWNETKKAFEIGGVWPAEFSSSAMSLEMNIGYPVSFGAIKVIPFAGIKGYGFVSFTDTELSSDFRTVKKYSNISTVTGGFGAIVDYNLKRTLKIVPTTNLNSKKLQEFNLRFKFSYTPVDFNNTLQASVFNATVGISYSSRVVKLH